MRMNDYKKNAPILLFVYNRLDHLKLTVEALKNNILAKDSDLIIYSDGARDKMSEDGVLKVREYIRGIDGFKSIKIIERDLNLGLAKSIINGVTECINLHGKVIVLEDDIVTSKYFLTYMNDALCAYEYEFNVACVHAYRYPINDVSSDFFIKGADCWGWGTWKRAWEKFEHDPLILLSKIKEYGYINDRFNIDCGYVDMLKDFIKGRNNSWAIRWYFSAFLNGMYCLYPKIPFAKNIGNDSSGTHCGTTNKFDVEIFDETNYSFSKIKIEESVECKEEIIKFHNKKLNIFLRIKNKIMRILNDAN